MFNYLLPSLIYVASAPFFWMEMGMTTASAMFIGATLYNGNFSMLKKGAVTLMGYAFFLLLTMSSRLYNLIATSQNIPNPERALAPIVSLGIVSVFFFVGLFLGVSAVNKVNRCHHKRSQYGFL